MCGILMVIFDLICENGHRFEGWFTSLSDLEAQMAGKLLSCPVCGAGNVARRPSTFGLVKSRPAEPPSVPDRAEPEDDGLDSRREMLYEAYSKLREVTKMLEREFDDVGANFSSEALKMHYGAAPKRNIRGMSTSDEERLLEKEGVDFLKVPMLTRKTPVTS
ncbi:MAG: DUF1178 family protein [Deltaproteobacteria bacterium]|nr:DUF1178 family protein [Deltaproteobacteria bacterium]